MLQTMQVLYCFNPQFVMIKVILSFLQNSSLELEIMLNSVVARIYQTTAFN